MNTTEMKELFNKFTGENSGLNLVTPFIQDGYVCATNGHILIRAKAEDVDFEATENPKAPRVPEEWFVQHQDFAIDLDRDKFNGFKTKPEYDNPEECQECSGDGEVTWEYEHYTMDADCPACNGTGESQEPRTLTGGKVFDGLTQFQIQKAQFAPSTIELLIDVAEYAHSPISVISDPNEAMRAVFNIGIFQVLAMGLYQSADQGHMNTIIIK